MNVFEWVWELCDELAESGRSDLARLIWEFDEHMQESRTDLVEASYPQIIAASRSLGLPWLEVYAKHFYHCMRLDNYDEGEKILNEVVSLFELAHREENKGCPQSICAVQDLVRCYSRIDGPNYISERREVILEAMEKIDPTWNCYLCLSMEWVDALNDEKKYEEASHYLAGQRSKIAAANETVQNDLIASQAVFSAECGRFEEAFAFLAEAEEGAKDYSETYRLGITIKRAYILAKAGRMTEADEALPEFELVLDKTGSNLLWMDALGMLVAAGVRVNDQTIGRALQIMAQRLENGGSHHYGCLVCALHIRLALQRKAFWTARQGLAAYERMRQRLRDPGRLARESAELAALIEANMPPPAPVPAERLLQYLRELPEGDAGTDPELGIVWLIGACAERPEDQDLILTTATLQSARGAETQADDLVTSYLARVPLDENAWGFLLNLRINRGDDAGVETLIRQCEEPFPTMAHFARARLDYVRGRDEDAIRACEKVIEADPVAMNTRRMQAAAARRIGDHALSARRLKEVTVDSEPGGDDWDLLISATVLGDGETIHRCCTRLGLDVKPEIAPAEWAGDQGYCRIVYTNAQGQEAWQLAMRLGPVTARIIEVDRPKGEQRYGDCVVFDAALANDAPVSDEEREHWLPAFRYVETLKKGGFVSWDIDGPDPGEEAWQAFRVALEQCGCSLWACSSSDYEVTDNETGETLAAVYAFVAAPDTMPPGEIAAMIEDLTASWPHRPSFLALAEAAQIDLARHEQAMERFGL